VYVCTKSGKIIREIGGNPSIPMSIAVSIAVDFVGNIVVIDFLNGLFIFDNKGTFVRQIYEKGGISGAVDVHGNIVIAFGNNGDHNHRVVVFGPTERVF